MPRPIVLDLEVFPEGIDFSKEQIVIVVCSTQGDGVAPYSAKEFCDWLFRGDLVGDWSETLFSICALGDRSNVLYRFFEVSF